MKNEIYHRRIGMVMVVVGALITQACGQEKKPPTSTPLGPQNTSEVTSSVDTETVLPGKWSGRFKRDNGETSTLSVEFFSDNTLVWFIEGQDAAEGTWSVLSDGRVQVADKTVTTILSNGVPILGEIQNQELILHGGPTGKFALAKRAN